MAWELPCVRLWTTTAPRMQLGDAPTNGWGLWGWAVLPYTWYSQLPKASDFLRVLMRLKWGRLRSSWSREISLSGVVESKSKHGSTTNTLLMLMRIAGLFLYSTVFTQKWGVRRKEKEIKKGKAANLSCCSLRSWMWDFLKLVKQILDIWYLACEMFKVLYEVLSWNTVRYTLR